MTQSPTDKFFDVWLTYKKVVLGDYMHHQDVAAVLNRTLRKRFGSEAFSVLDLGCGDCATLAPILSGLNVKSYTGVDLSQTALALARAQFTGVGYPVRLACGDLVDGLAASDGFDLIYSSFALHHLTTSMKSHFFALAALRLNPGGLLVLVDIVRENEETLVEFHRRYCAWVRESWNELEQIEKESVCEHVVTNDLPETLATLVAQAGAAGFDADPGGIRHDSHQVMFLRRQSSGATPLTH